MEKSNDIAGRFVKQWLREGQALPIDMQLSKLRDMIAYLIDELRREHEKVLQQKMVETIARYAPSVSKEPDQFLTHAGQAAMARLPEGFGLILIGLPTAKAGEELFYASNLSRRDAWIVIKEWTARAQKDESWKEHIS